MSLVTFTAIGEICGRGSVKDTDVALLRRAFAQEACLQATDADALCHIQDACRVQDPAWAEFFIATITEYIVREVEPSGYLTHDHAAWLIARISSEGRVRTKTELDLLLNVLKRSRWAPQSLVRFALAQVLDTVVAGTGPLRAGSVLEPGRIIPAEVEAVRSILCAYGAEGTMAITRAEAEILFAIDDAVRADEAVPRGGRCGWSDLFLKAIACAVMAASGYAVPSRADVLRREHEFSAVIGLSGSEQSAGPIWRASRGLLASYRSQSSEERALARLERQRVEIITGESVLEVDAAWLAERLGRNGGLGRNEQVLLAAFKRAGTALDPALHQVVERHCRAA